MRTHPIAVFALVLASGFGVAAQSNTSHETHSLKPGEVAMIGCLQRESDYRAQHNGGSGGPLGSGLGVGNEYVLAQAKPVSSTGSGPVQSGISRDFSLTGQLEKDMVREIGRMVEVVGTVKEDGKNLPKITVTLAHPVGDFCPTSQAK